jgi:hypothetical protein
MPLKALLAFTRIPGNAFSFWIRQTLHWSRGNPKLYQESKDHLFAYLESGQAQSKAEAREAELNQRYQLAPLAKNSTAALYRKNLYLLDTLETVTEDLPCLKENAIHVKALDIGSQDWHYVFGLERWLRFKNRPVRRSVSLTGIELDGYGIYADFHSRHNYAQAYVEQTENPAVHYQIGDFLKVKEGAYDIISIFYPFVTRHQILLWGLPLRFFSPKNFLEHAAALTKVGGCLLVYCHSQLEQNLFLEFGRSIPALTLVREGPVVSNLVDFYEDIEGRRFSIWQKN